MIVEANKADVAYLGCVDAVVVIVETGKADIT